MIPGVVIAAALVAAVGSQNPPSFNPTGGWCQTKDQKCVVRVAYKGHWGYNAILTYRVGLKPCQVRVFEDWSGQINVQGHCVKFRPTDEDLWLLDD